MTHFTMIWISLASMHRSPVPWSGSPLLSPIFRTSIIAAPHPTLIISGSQNRRASSTRMFFRRPQSIPTLILARSLAMTVAVDPIINCLHPLELIPCFYELNNVFLHCIFSPDKMPIPKSLIPCCLQDSPHLSTTPLVLH